jgi:predicted alpha/beta-fold hydrolase
MTHTAFREAADHPAEPFPAHPRRGTFQTGHFHPRRFLGNGHLQTVVGNFLARPDGLPPATPELIEVSPATATQISSQVLCHCHWQPQERRAQSPAVILVHGLEGSSNSQYVVGNANKLWKAGANVIRMNMRNCGGTERLSPTLYHSGLSGDVAAVMRHFLQREALESISLVGYSMGGNLVLKLAGELGDHPPAQLKSVIGISPAVDLGPSAAELHKPHNRFYERRFLRALLKRYRRKTMLFPRAYDPNRATGIKSLWEFDDRITALYSGFTSAEDYYHRAAAARVIDRIAVPTLVLHALDDPFVKLTPETVQALQQNPSITFIQTSHGGHCAFLATPVPGEGDDGYWAETTLLRFILQHA